MAGWPSCAAPTMCRSNCCRRAPRWPRQARRERRAAVAGHAPASLFPGGDQVVRHIVLVAGRAVAGDQGLQIVVPGGGRCCGHDADLRVRCFLQPAADTLSPAPRPATAPGPRGRAVPRDLERWSGGLAASPGRGPSPPGANSLGGRRLEGAAPSAPRRPQRTALQRPGLRHAVAYCATTTCGALECCGLTQLLCRAKRG